jgi:cobalamin biosynthesis Mg chelatase CobN
MQGSTDVTTQAATSGETSGDTVPVVARVYATNTADGLAPQANKVQVSLQVDGAEIDAATAQAGEVVTLQLPTNATSGHEVSVSFAGDKTISGAREAIGVAPAAAVVESTNEADASKQNTNANSGTTKKTASNANAEAVSKKSTSKSTFSQVGDGTLIRFALLGGLAVLSLGVLLYVVRRPSF